jgi:hypothetical protein
MVTVPGSLKVYARLVPSPRPESEQKVLHKLVSKTPDQFGYENMTTKPRQFSSASR